METIIGISDKILSSEQNAEGKYDVMIKRNNINYRTGFIFDTIKVLGEYTLRVSQTDLDGNKKYGVITVCRDPMYFPCIFDKIKPYKGSIVQAISGEEEFFITRFGAIYTKEFMEIRNL
jgi:hypothetical protein